MSRVQILFFILVLGITAGCSTNDFDRSLILENVTDNLVIPAYQDFEVRSDSLHRAVITFTENPTEENLASAKMAWEEAIKSWKRAEVYNFGPVEDMVLVTSIDRWPASEGGIEAAVEEFDGSDDYLMRIGSNRKGLPAIEYLLFSDEPRVIIQEFQDANRRGFLKLLTGSLTDISQRVLDAWQNSYQQQFTEAVGNRPNSGITLLTNEIGYLLEMIRMDKLEIPFGAQTGGVPRLQMLESEYAEVSKELIYENLESAQQTFNGGSGQGFDDYLNALDIEGEDGKLLSEVINEEYDHALAIIKGMDGSLREAIQNEKERVEQLIESVQRLYIYTEVDMISQLSILDTFSDNDGD